ncbi:MAG: hypothetical protein VX589_01355 [Myxococcota bacterium]|nr:hypothetical protein [Myxococcota bacterium]
MKQRDENLRDLFGLRHFEGGRQHGQRSGGNVVDVVSIRALQTDARSVERARSRLGVQDQLSAAIGVTSIQASTDTGDDHRGGSGADQSTLESGDGQKA